MKSFTFLCVFLIPSLASPFAFAENKSQALLLEDSVKRAIEANPDILKAREAVRQSDATTSLSVSRVFPVLNGTITAGHLKAASNSSSPLFRGDPYNQYGAKIDLTQPIYDASLFAAYRFAKKEQEIRGYAASLVERSVTEQVFESFYSILLQERLLKIFKEAQRVDNETLAEAIRYQRVGRAQKLDVLQLKTQVALLTPKIAQAESSMQTNAAHLATLLRNLDASSIRIKGAFVIPDASWVKRTIETSRKELPELRQAKALVDQFEDTRNVQMAPYWPKLSFLANYQRLGYKKQDLMEDSSTSWGLQFQLSIPLFSGLSSFRQREALASQAKQLEFDETRMADSVSVSQIQTERNFEVAVTQLESTRQAALYGTESLKEAQRSYRLGLINYLQYQASEQAYLDSQVGFLQAKFNYILNLMKYFHAMGVPSSSLIDQIAELTRKNSEE